ncbi:MAG: PQQ-binding-like beta-propeller repeat protein [Bacteroidia bacterium]|nr:PQQ-binding-like beta-propeller repeat protein [Bacteroidia bacterium]
MKTLFYFFVVFSVISLKGFSQGGYPADLNITINNPQKEPLAHLELKLFEANSAQPQYALTNSKGFVKFKVKRGVKYSLGIKNDPMFTEIAIPEKGTQPVTQNIIYDKPVDNTNYDTTNFKNFKFRNPTDNEVIIKVLVYGDKFKTMPGKKVRLVCDKIKKVFVSTTESSGSAPFVIYPGFKYTIGVENFDNMGEINVPDKGGMMSETKVFYQPTDIREKVSNDTISHDLKKDQQATSTHVLVNIKLWDMSFKLLPNEYIYMDRTGTKQVYAAKTDEKGIVNFLLPKGVEFTINLKYERDIDVINQPMGPDLHRINIEFNYMGSEKIESFYKDTRRDKNGFLTEFMSPKVSPCKFDPGWIEKTKDGYHVNFPSKSATSPPAAHGEKIYINSGYYSPEFYCIDGKTGNSDWGARLAENGISSSIYMDDVILANTESCTLYALDAKSGRMLWSKWLGPNIYSTPTVTNGKVIVVYPNELDSRYKAFNKINNEDNHFVIVAFDLKSGNILWQNWVDHEALAAPVICNGKVYMTSMNGSLYQFDLNNGKQLFVAKDKAVTPPTVVDDFIFVCLQNAKDEKKQELAVYDAKTMKLIARHSQISGKNLFKSSGLGAAERMTYSGGRVTHFKGKNYNVTDGKLFCFDNTGKISWEVKLNQTTFVDSLPKCSMPVVAGNKIMVNNGKKIQLYDPMQGKLIKEFPTNTELFADAIACNGWIYTGSKKGKIISIDTKDPDITGWEMWSGNPQHNPVIK